MNGCPSMAAGVFVKTPGYSQVKTRLAETIGARAAEMFHRLSSMAVASVLVEASSMFAVRPYWAVAEPEAVHDPLWRGFPVISQGEGGLGHRLDRVYRLLRQRHRAVVFLGADSPQIQASHVRQAYHLLSSDQHATVIGPSSDGGFYLCGGNVELKSSAWTDVAYGTDQAAGQWCANVEPTARAFRLETLFDVDYFEGLIQLKAALSGNTRHLTAAQRRLLEWLMKVGYVTGDSCGCPEHVTSVDICE